MRVRRTAPGAATQPVAASSLGSGYIRRCPLPQFDLRQSVPQRILKETRRYIALVVGFGEDEELRSMASRSSTL